MGIFVAPTPQRMCPVSRSALQTTLTTSTSTCPIIMHSYYYLLLIAVCNRTYYGDIGRTYSLRVPPPQWTRLPFLCHLTFTASGHEQGDLVQVSPSQFIWHFHD